MITLERLDKQIEEMEQQLESVKGRPCLVYSRIVGYYQPVQMWNPGKRQEFAERKPFEAKDLNERL